MLNRSKRLILAVAAMSAVALVPAPAQATEALGPCTVRPLFTIADWRQSVAIAGFYQSPGAIDIQLTCGVIRNGVTVARVSETAPGPVAVVAGVEDVLVGSYMPCYEVRVTYINRTTSADTCP